MLEENAPPRMLISHGACSGTKGRGGAAGAAVAESAGSVVEAVSVTMVSKEEEYAVLGFGCGGAAEVMLGWGATSIATSSVGDRVPTAIGSWLALLLSVCTACSFG